MDRVVQPDIYIAFRFHGNFYHSYRGDTPDELGFGQDIRVIRHVVATLDRFNAQGVPVRGTWDFENCFSLEQIMPKYCPDLIAALQRRVAAGDEMNLMSYNNGLISAHTAREFEAAIRRGISNPQGSGLRDLFGAGFRPIVRPQEMLYTPIHLQLYRASGIDTISLYYSALPFNGFSSFVPPLSFVERYNPLTLTYPGIAESMTLLPCYSVGDLADHLTLRRWIKQLRRQQLALAEPVDALLLIDMDADDEFWAGFGVPLLTGRFSTVSGLQGVVENAAGLDYVKWTTPGAYLVDHPPRGNLAIGQDTADGSFDGHSSWAEKHSNHRLWTGLDRARILDLQARRLVDAVPPAAAALLDGSFEARLKLLSTTHFGMAAPVMNVTREAIACDLAAAAVEAAAGAFRLVAPPPLSGRFSLLDYVRGDSAAGVSYDAHPSSALVRLPLRDAAPESFALLDAAGRAVPSAVIPARGRRELAFVARFEPNERQDYSLDPARSPEPAASNVLVTPASLQNDTVALDFDRQGHVTGARFEDAQFSLARFIRSGLSYAGQRYEVESWTETESLSLGIVGIKRFQGNILFKGGYLACFEREVALAAGLPYVYVTMQVTYPRTPDHGYGRGLAERLEQAWDNRWREVMPCEIAPALAGRPDSPLRVWKHNYCDHVSSYALDYERFSKNSQLDSVNNHITHGWVAVADGERGVLVAHSADSATGMAFCPLRTRREDRVSRVRLNPFGTYWGKQYTYATADTGLGNFLATTLSASGHIKSYAPSYNGCTQEFSLLIAPFRGDRPPDAVRYAAEAFAYPYLVLEDDRWIAPPPHRSWDGAGLGQPRSA